jgi:prephenate dehydrogenase
MLGMALTAAGPDAGVDEVLLLDASPGVAQESLERGAGHRVSASLDDALSADTIVLAIPVDEIVRWLHDHGASVGAGALVIDTGSAKRGVVEAMRRTVPGHAHSMGGHPVAGTELPGPAGADPARLAGATFVLCAVRNDPEAAARSRALAQAAGARPFELDAGEHDRVIARTSHLPHLAACALATVAGALVEGGGDAPRLLASTGFAGATRLAAGDPTMVSSFLRANAREVSAALADLAAELALLGRALEDADPAALEEALAAGRASRRAVG